MGEVMGRVVQVSPHLDDGRLGLFVGVARLFVLVEGLVVFGIADQLLFVEGPGPRVVLRLVFVFGLAAGQLSFRLFQFGLERHLVHLGDQLSGVHHVVVVHVELVDDARHLRTDIHLRDRLHRTGGP